MVGFRFRVYALATRTCQTRSLGLGFRAPGFRLTHSHKAGMASGNKSAQLAASTSRDEPFKFRVEGNKCRTSAYQSFNRWVVIVQRARRSGTAPENRWTACRCLKINGSVEGPQLMHVSVYLYMSKPVCTYVLSLYLYIQLEFLCCV